MPTSFFYPIITQHDLCCTLKGFTSYPEECRVPVPSLNSSDDNKNLHHLNRYWRAVDGFVREQFAGWKERQVTLQRMSGSSEGGWKWGWKEVSESEDEMESPGGRKRTVSGPSVKVNSDTEVWIRAFQASTPTCLNVPVVVQFVTFVCTRAGNAIRGRITAQMVPVQLVRPSTLCVGLTVLPYRPRPRSSTTRI